MNFTLITEENSPKISSIKKKYNVFRVIKMKNGNLKIIELFNKDGIFRGFGRSTKEAYKKAKKVIKNYYTV